MDITYHLNRSRKRRKTIALEISENAELIIRAPFFTSVTEINRFVAEKQNWIERTIRKRKAQNALRVNRQWVTGETLYYLGEPYPLNVFSDPWASEGVTLKDHGFDLNAGKNSDLKKYHVVRWYKETAKTIIRQRTDFFSRMLQLPYGNLTITSAQKRWGSCSAQNDLSFSFRLVMTPPPVIDYVIVHELSHIRHKNHSARFWSQVQKGIPEYRQIRRWLKEHHNQFNL